MTIDTLFLILSAVLYATASLCSMLKLLHIMQLGSYQFPAYFRAIKRRGGGIALRIILAIALVLVILLTDGALRLGILSFIYLLATLFTLPRKAKKPLKYTSRLTRMLIVAGVLHAAALIPFIMLRGDTLSTFILAASYLLSVLIVSLARLITAPVDYSIRQGLIKDAKRILSSMPDLRIVGVTGSFGKTSVKYYLQALLSESYETLMTPGSFNTPMGVVRTIRENLRPTHQIFICEMGARHVGDIKEICDIVEPSAGIVTAIGKQHLETFKTFENIRNTKLELFDSVKTRSGLMLINGDSDLGDKLSEYPNAITYGTSEKNAYRVENIQSTESGMNFTAVFPDGSRHNFETGLLGEHSAINILGALAYCAEIGMNTDKLRMPIRRLKSVPHRLELIRIPDGAIIDDAFNSNPEGSRAALNTLKGFSGMRILITPGMVELGGEEEELNREFGRTAAMSCDMVYLVGRKHTKPIHDGLLENGFPETSIVVLDTFNEAISRARAVSTDGKRRIILIENDLPDNY